MTTIQKFSIIDVDTFETDVGGGITFFGGIIGTDVGPVDVFFPILRDYPEDVISIEGSGDFVSLDGYPLRYVLDVIAERQRNEAERLQEELNSHRSPADRIKYLLKRGIGGMPATNTVVRPGETIAFVNGSPTTIYFMEADFAEACRTLGDDVVIRSGRDFLNTDRVTGWGFRMLALRDHVSHLWDGTVLHRIDGIGYDRVTPTGRFKLARFYAIRHFGDDVWLVAPTERGVKRMVKRYQPIGKPVQTEIERPPELLAADVADDTCLSYMVF